MDIFEVILQPKVEEALEEFSLWGLETGISLDAIIRYLERIREKLQTLVTFPFRGRAGLEDTRELVLDGTPFTAIYLVEETQGIVVVLDLIPDRLRQESW